MIEAAQISDKEIIDKYLPVRYKHRGRDPRTGLDCYGLIIAIYRDFNISLLDIKEDYDEDWAWEGRNHFIENYHREWERTINPDPYNVVLFLSSKGVANHGGVILKRGRFIHCAKAGVVVSRLSDPRWKERTEGFYRFRGPGIW